MHFSLPSRGDLTRFPTRAPSMDIGRCDTCFSQNLWTFEMCYTVEKRWPAFTHCQWQCVSIWLECTTNSPFRVRRFVGKSARSFGKAMYIQLPVHLIPGTRDGDSAAFSFRCSSQKGQPTYVAGLRRALLPVPAWVGCFDRNRSVSWAVNVKFIHPDPSTNSTVFPGSGRGRLAGVRE